MSPDPMTVQLHESIALKLAISPDPIKLQTKFSTDEPFPSTSPEPVKDTLALVKLIFGKIMSPDPISETDIFCFNMCGETIFILHDPVSEILFRLISVG